MTPPFDPASSPVPASRASNPLPPWVAVGADFIGHRDWRIESITGQWICVVEKRSSADAPNEAWIYLPTGVVYGSTILIRRSEHGMPVTTR